MKRCATRFSVYITLKAWKTTAERTRVIEILIAAYHEGRLPEVSDRPSSGQIARYFALVPPDLKNEAGRVLKSYARFVRNERADIAWEARVKLMPSRANTRNTASNGVPKRDKTKTTWPPLT